jgi:hypothetical protein
MARVSNLFQIGHDDPNDSDAKPDLKSSEDDDGDLCLLGTPSTSEDASSISPVYVVEDPSYTAAERPWFHEMDEKYGMLSDAQLLALIRGTCHSYLHARTRLFQIDPS